jgi:hypothetical protein
MMFGSHSYYFRDLYRQGITWLMSEGYIFETFDADHAKIVAG